MPNKHTNTDGWWAIPDEYLTPPTKRTRHELCGFELAAQTSTELELMVRAHERVCHG